MLRYRFQYYVLLLICVVALAACDRMPPVDPYAPSVISDWPLPTQQWNSDLPGLALTPDGRLLLSWINNQQGRRTALQFSAYSPARQHWLNRPTTIAVGNNLNTIAVMTPRMLKQRSGILWATWKQESETGLWSDIVVSRSRDGGARWSTPQTPYDPYDADTNVPPFISLLFSLLWLDREERVGISLITSHVEYKHWSHHLSTTSMDNTGQLGVEVILDLRFCAGGNVAQTSRGPLLAWRSNAGDTESIMVARRNADGWGTPVRIHTAASYCMKTLAVYDKIALAAHDKTAIVAWRDVVDATNHQMSIHMVYSGDAGDTFAKSVEIVSGLCAYPLAVALDAQQAWVLWQQRESADVLSLWFARLSTDLRTEYERREIVSINLPEDSFDRCFARIKRSDFVLSEGTGYLVWAQWHDRGNALHGVTIQPGAAAVP